MTWWMIAGLVYAIVWPVVFILAVHEEGIDSRLPPDIPFVWGVSTLWPMMLLLVLCALALEVLKLPFKFTEHWITWLREENAKTQDGGIVPAYRTPRPPPPEPEAYLDYHLDAAAIARQFAWLRQSGAPIPGHPCPPHPDNPQFYVLGKPGTATMYGESRQPVCGPSVGFRPLGAVDKETRDV